MHKNAVTIVTIIPKTNPEYMKAAGIARIPVPSDAFSKCVSVSASLFQEMLIIYKNLVNKNSQD